MTAEMQEAELRYADKIGKLLNQAESTTGPESEAFMEKAAKLMVEYAIDEQMIAAARGLQVDELVQDYFTYLGIYQDAHIQVGVAAAKHFGLKVVTDFGRKQYTKPCEIRLNVVGFRADVERARLLDTSLQLQAVAAHAVWWKASKADMAWMDRGLTYRTRRDFVFGFANGVDVKLSRARRAAVAEAARHEAERSHVSAEAAKQSVALVLVNRKDRVDEYYDTVWGGRTRNVHHNYGTGARGGRAQGYQAGQSANTNAASGRLGGARGAIGR